MDRGHDDVQTLFVAVAMGCSTLALEWYFVLSPPDQYRKLGNLHVEVACFMASALLSLCFALALDRLPELSRKNDRLVLERQAVLGRLSKVSSTTANLARRRGLAVAGGLSARYETKID
eukprot:scaffold30424_cov27-Prasinocladus_malaysianus.AAC.2